MYEFQERVRYSETDERGRMTLLSVLNALQDCSTFHLKDVGLSVEELRKQGRSWLLSAWDIRISRLPELYESITIGTSPHSFHGILAHRNFWIKDSRERFLLRAESEWFSLDTERMRPARVKAEMLTPFGEMRDVLHLPELVRRISLPDQLHDGGSFRVMRQQIDSNHHVNNAQYIALSLELLQDSPEGFPAFSRGRIRAEYQKAARFGDLLCTRYGEREGRRIVSIQNPEGEVFCNVEIGEDPET